MNLYEAGINSQILRELENALKNSYTSEFENFISDEVNYNYKNNLTLLILEERSY